MPYMLAPGARLYVGPHGQMEESLGACCAPCAAGGSCSAMGATPAHRRRRSRPRHQPLHGILDMLGLTSSSPTDTSSNAGSAFLAQATDVTPFTTAAAPAAPASSGGNWLTGLLSAVTTGAQSVAAQQQHTAAAAASQAAAAYRPPAPAAGGMTQSQMIMIGGVAVLGLGAVVLLTRKR